MGFDFFTVPTLGFRTLYCLFVIEHGRRRILHFNCTAHPTSDWIVQQLRHALPLPCPYRYVLFDRDAQFGNEVIAFLKASGIEPLRTSVRSPWQNGIAEQWVGSARREMLDHIIPINESHLRRLGFEYLAYYHEDRTHLGLVKDTPAHRAIEHRPNEIRAGFIRSLEWVDSIIATVRQQRPDRTHERPKDSLSSSERNALLRFPLLR